MWSGVRICPPVKLNDSESGGSQIVAHALEGPEEGGAHRMIERLAILPVKKPEENTPAGPQYSGELLKDFRNIRWVSVDQRVPREDASAVIRRQRQLTEISALEFCLRIGGPSMADEFFRQVNANDLSVISTQKIGPMTRSAACIQ